MAARISDRVTYAYCMGCGGLLLKARQVRYGTEVWHACCALTESFIAWRGQVDRRN